MLFIIIRIHKPRFYLENILRNTQKKGIYTRLFTFYIGQVQNLCFNKFNFIIILEERVNNGYNPYFPLQFVISKTKSINHRTQD